MTAIETNVGSPEQWAALEELHPGINAVVDCLFDLATHVATAEVKIRGLPDEIVFALSRICIEECYELFLLAANRYDFGASTLLRSLYERVVTCAYINKFPDKAQRFADYAIIQNHRLVVHARKLVSDEMLEENLPIGTLAQMESDYERVRRSFQRTKCKQCKTTETAPSWDVDLATMAEMAGEGLSNLYLVAYAAPTLHAHTTLSSAFSRIRDDEERVTFSYEPNLQSIVGSVVLAITLLTVVLRQTIKRFSLPLTEYLQRVEAEIRGKLVR